MTTHPPTQTEPYLTAVVPGVLATDNVYGRYQILVQMSAALGDSTLETCMEHLSGFSSGGEPDRPRRRVLLGIDSAPFSLTYQWETLIDNKWEMMIFGGLIFHLNRQRVGLCAIGGKIHEDPQHYSFTDKSDGEDTIRILLGDWSLHS